MPASSARDTACRCSAASPRTISPPTAPQPNPSAETVRPVLPRGRCSIGLTLLVILYRRRRSAGTWPRPGRNHWQVLPLDALVVHAEAARLIVRQRRRAVQVAGVHPDPPRALRPGMG